MLKTKYYLSYSCTTFSVKNILIGKVIAMRIYEKKTNREPQQLASSDPLFASINSPKKFAFNYKNYVRSN